MTAPEPRTIPLRIVVASTAALVVLVMGGLVVVSMGGSHRAQLATSSAPTVVAPTTSTALAPVVTVPSRTMTTAPAPAPTVTATVPAPPTSTPARAVTIRGAFTTAWIIASELQPWPGDCTPVGQSYQVQIRDGAGTIMALGSVATARVTKRAVGDSGALDLDCAFTYTATVAPSPVYTLALLESGKTLIDSHTVSLAEVTAGKVPTLASVFCPTCTP